ncbi:MAG TPA: hypothetical protein VN903_15425 [Polyangia bacterium]|nr:hypothetical protein [Polyangia bacterium]
MSVKRQGRRVAEMDDLMLPGDYTLGYNSDGQIVSMWFSMPGFPSHRWNRINGPAAEREPRWEITEDAEGVVHVEPSIRTQWTEGQEPRCFHGFLHHGVWEVLDDSIGAELSGT